jgi:hypothetical protein
MTEDEQVQEITQWFALRGYELLLHEVAGAWRAAYAPRRARIASLGYASGKTQLEAALAAQEQFEREHPSRRDRRGTTSFLVETHDTAMSVEDAIAVQKSTQTLGEETVGYELPLELERIEQAEEQLLGHGWNLWFEPEPDGTLTAIVRGDDGELLRTLTGLEDHEDAFVQLGIELRPPSTEVRREQQRRRDKP